MDKYIAHILVVDDDDGIRSLVKQYLKENKFLVTTAVSAEDASEKIKIIEGEFGIQIITHPFENLLIECAKDVNANIIIRGLRAVSDFEYEFQMVGMNRVLSNEIETVFLMADNSYQSIASKLVKEIARLGGDTKNFVPSSVHKRLINITLES